MYHSVSHQEQLLNTITLHYEKEDEEDDHEGMQDSSSIAQPAFRIVRKAGNMTSLSGADNMAYMEY